MPPVEDSSHRPTKGKLDEFLAPQLDPEIAIFRANYYWAIMAYHMSCKNADFEHCAQST
jgi:hypothetical protein